MIKGEILVCGMTSNSRRSTFSRGHVSVVRKDITNYELFVRLANDPNDIKFPLSEKDQCWMAHNFIDKGRLTLRFDPRVNRGKCQILIRAAKPGDLSKLVTSVKEVMEGKIPSFCGRIPPKNWTRVSGGKRQIDQHNVNDQLPIDLSHCVYSHPTRLIPQIFRLKSLVSLNLTVPLSGFKPSELKHIRSIGNLVNLRSLNLEGSGLGLIDEDLLTIFFTSLPISLETLEVGNNSLKTFPNVLHCENLADLDLNSNKIQILPSRICYFLHLRRLNIQHNQIAYLPGTMTQMRELKSISFVGNPLTMFESKFGNSFGSETNIVFSWPFPDNVMLTRRGKHGDIEYCHDDGVPTLLAICADVVQNSQQKFVKVAKDVLPVDLYARTIEIPLCSMCGRSKFIRSQVRECTPTASFLRNLSLSERSIIIVRYDHCRICGDVWQQRNPRRLLEHAEYDDADDVE